MKKLRVFCENHNDELLLQTYKDVRENVIDIYVKSCPICSTPPAPSEPDVFTLVDDIRGGGVNTSDDWDGTLSREECARRIVAFAKTLSSPPPAKPSELEIKPATLEAINKYPALQSVLYDENLLPECVRTEHERDKLEYFVAGYMLAQTYPPAPPEGKRYVCNRCGKRVNESDLSDDKTRHAVQVSTREEGNIDVDFCGPVVEEKEAGKL